MIDVRTDAVSDEAPASLDAPRPLLRRRSVLVPLVVLALLLGFGAAYLAFREPAGPSVFAGEPSVEKLDLPAGTPVKSPAAPVVAPTVANEPVSARDALDQYLRAEVARDSETAFSLVDAKTQQTEGSVASWLNTRANRLLPEQFDILEERAGNDGVDITISATRTPSVSPLTGLAPAKSEETWRVVESGGWRVVGGEPLEVRPVLPSNAAASAAGAAWLARVAACDSAGAAGLQLSQNLLGSPTLGDATCKKKGTWTAGDAFPVAELPNSTVFVSAYGPGVGRWARAVPVTGAGRYTIVLAPLGDEWRVMGVIPEGSPRP